MLLFCGRTEVFMRIALLSPAKSVHTLKWAAALSEKGHSVRVFSIKEHAAKEGLYPSQVEMKYINCGGGAGYWFGGAELKKFLGEFKPDILNAHYATGYGTLARKCGFHPLLLSVWGSDVYDFPEKGSFCKKLLVKNLENAEALASTSNVMAERVRSLYNCGKKIYITPFGVDTDKFSRLGEPDKRALTIGIVKTLEPKYGVDFLLRAFALLKARLEKENKIPEGGLNLLIYGSGSKLGDLKKLSVQLGIDGWVDFKGAVPHSQVPEILCGLDIYCAPSVLDSESFGVAAVEAMSCMVPVAVSDADGFREVVEDNVTGFIVKKRDFVTLANKLYILACDRELRKRMGEAGRKRVMEKYRWQDNVLEMEAALSETLMEYRAGKPDSIRRGRIQ